MIDNKLSQDKGNFWKKIFLFDEFLFDKIFILQFLECQKRRDHHWINENMMIIFFKKMHKFIK